MVKRTIAVICTFAFLAMTSTAHAGGMAPGIPGPAPKLSGPTINGVMVVDTHTDGSTIVTSAGSTPVVGNPLPDPSITEYKAKLASIWLQRGGATASAIFRLPLAFAAFLGCDLTKTTARFAFDPGKFADNALTNWMPSDTVNAIFFTAQGLNLPLTAGTPVITTISNAVCTADPENPKIAGNPPDLTPPSGILSFEFNIQFIQP